ncbi:hypothetical protein TrVFT333_002068 [Trichoderma virens FT-333]|nr:hypothetical protein TrVFT333_002068 [Trichoderma virens FT-333]
MSEHPAHYTGEFHARVPPSEPMMKGGHQPGIKVGNDRLPESHLETFPPGTAPPNHPSDQIPRQKSQARPTTPKSTPLAGQTPRLPRRHIKGRLEGREVASQLPGKKHTGTRTQHPHGQKEAGTGLGAIAANVNKTDPVREHGWDLPEGVEKGARGKGSENWPGAEDVEPVKADEIASERARELDVE